MKFIPILFTFTEYYYVWNVNLIPPTFSFQRLYVFIRVVVTLYIGAVIMRKYIVLYTTDESINENKNMEIFAYYDANQCAYYKDWYAISDHAKTE